MPLAPVTSSSGSTAVAAAVANADFLPVAIAPGASHTFTSLRVLGLPHLSVLIIQTTGAVIGGTALLEHSVRGTWQTLAVWSLVEPLNVPNYLVREYPAAEIRLTITAPGAGAVDYTYLASLAGAGA